MIFSVSALLLSGAQAAADPADLFPRLAAAHDCLVAEVDSRVSGVEEAPTVDARDEMALATARACQHLIEAAAESGEPLQEAEYSNSHVDRTDEWLFVSARYFAVRLIDDHFAGSGSENTE